VVNIGLPGLLFLIFLVLKLTGNIMWGWFWVFLPLLAIPALIAMGLVVAGLVGITRIVLTYLARKRGGGE
jgi:hypothetical protein